jgi:hypothetical protein
MPKYDTTPAAANSVIVSGKPKRSVRRDGVAVCPVAIVPPHPA